MNVRRFIAACMLMLPAAAGAQAPTDAEAVALLLRPVAEEAAARVQQPGVLLRVLPDGAPVTVTQVFAEELQERGRRVYFTEAGAEAVLTVDVRDMHSSTASSGNSSYFRTMDVTLGVLLQDTGEGQITWSREFQRSRTDTLDGEAPYAQRNLLGEQPSFWDGLFEPLLVTASAVVIAILLFTVRGS